jgi:uncharacterized lipoprotein YajG
MIRVSGRTVVLSMAFLALGGCATSRSELKLTSPTPVAPVAASSAKGAVFIRSINDRRMFEEAPSDPSVPSLGFEGATGAPDALKSRAIGRKRNTYGKALGDVLLEDGQTVTAVVRENLVAAFTEAGYRVETDPMAASVPMVIDVDVKKFWAWFQPGFWAITLNADIVADIKHAGAATPKTITAHAEDKRQAATDGAWMEIVQSGLTDFRAQVVAGGLKQ